MSGFYATLAIIVALGMALWVICLRRVRARRLFAAGGAGAGGCLCLAVAALAAAVLLNLHTYERLTYEQPIAELRFVAVDQQHYLAALTTPDERLRLANLRGDAWQLDARVLKWHGYANLLGFDALYRLERISGRYRDIHEAKTRPHSAAALHAGEPGLNAYALSRRLPRWASPVDAEYGSATYLPMAHGAAYTVALTQSGIVARPANDAAREAIRRW